MFSGVRNCRRNLHSFASKPLVAMDNPARVSYFHRSAHSDTIGGLTMPLQFRLARRSDYDRLEHLTIESFEPITWMKKADRRFGPLNGKDWHRRWEIRFRKAFDSQTFLLGEVAGEIVALASGTVDPDTHLGYIDLLAVDQ